MLSVPAEGAGAGLRQQEGTGRAMADDLGGKSVLVLGAYGLIGWGIVRRLGAAGARVTGLGRDEATARRVFPGLDWVIADIATLSAAEAWVPHLRGIAAVVNCAGALQDGPSDDLEAVHHLAVAALAEACAAAGVALVQISAVGATPDARTAFLASKARGDAAIRASGCEAVILRPGLILAPSAYGGTALLRMLAAVPLVQPVAMEDARVQTVALADLAGAVVAALAGRVPAGFEGDLVEADAHPLPELLAGLRRWLGFAEARAVLPIGPRLTALIGCGADLLGRLGWRSALRTTALEVLAEDVRGDPAAWDALRLGPMRPLQATLAAMPARREDRLAARLALLMPLMVGSLALLWLVSGVVGLIRSDAAAEILVAAGWAEEPAHASVLLWSLVDLALGAAILVRRWAGAACWGMVAVSLVYLAAATAITPHLWADPLGPLVKILPALVLALVTRAMLESR